MMSPFSTLLGWEIGTCFGDLYRVINIGNIAKKGLNGESGTGCYGIWQGFLLVG